MLSFFMLLDRKTYRHVGARNGVHHPEDELEVCCEVDILVGGQHGVHPVLDDLDEVGVLHQPRGVEGEGERGLVGLVVPPEVVVKEGSQVRLLLHVRATAHKLAAGQCLGNIS